MAKIFSKKDSAGINLLPEREFAYTVTGRVLSWIISTFRIIVIVTEILVMIAFLSRFWLDAQNTDLTEELDQKKAVVIGSESFEKQFEDTQKRLGIYSTLVKQKQSSPYLELVSKNLPPDVQISEIAINDNEIVITGDTANERSVQQIIVNLIATKEFAGVSLQEIKSTPTSDQLFTFTIQCVVEQKGGTS